MSRNGRQVAFGTVKGFLEVWDLDSGDPVYAGNLGGRDLRRLAFGPDGSILLAERDDGAVMLVAQPRAKGVATRRLSASTGEPGHRPRPWLSSDRKRFLLRRDGKFSVPDLDLLSDWELAECDLPLEVLTGCAKLLAGQHLNANGVMLALPPQELAALCRSLRVRAPHLFE